MSNAEIYAEDSFYEKTKVTLNDDNRFDKVFDSIDIVLAYCEGQSDITPEIIDRIFTLQREYLIRCRLNGEYPTNESRNEYIMQHWYLI
jgi:hypothetical protein